MPNMALWMISRSRATAGRSIFSLSGFFHCPECRPIVMWETNAMLMLNDPILFQRFEVAEKFHANFYHGFMDAPQIESLRLSVQLFVNRVLALPELNNRNE